MHRHTYPGIADTCYTLLTSIYTLSSNQTSQIEQWHRISRNGLRHRSNSDLVCVGVQWGESEISQKGVLLARSGGCRWLYASFVPTYSAGFQALWPRKSSREPTLSLPGAVFSATVHGASTWRLDAPAALWIHSPREKLIQGRKIDKNIIVGA